MNITEPAQAHLDALLKDGELLEIGLVGGGCGGATVVLSKVPLMSSDALSIGGTTNVIFADQTSQTYLIGGKLTLNWLWHLLYYPLLRPTTTSTCTPTFHS